MAPAGAGSTLTPGVKKIARRPFPSMSVGAPKFSVSSGKPSVSNAVPKASRSCVGVAAGGRRRVDEDDGVRKHRRDAGRVQLFGSARRRDVGVEIVVAADDRRRRQARQLPPAQQGRPQAAAPERGDAWLDLRSFAISKGARRPLWPPRASGRQPWPAGRAPRRPSPRESSSCSCR